MLSRTHDIGIEALIQQQDFHRVLRRAGSRCRIAVRHRMYTPVSPDVRAEFRTHLRRCEELETNRESPNCSRRAWLEHEKNGGTNFGWRSAGTPFEKAEPEEEVVAKPQGRFKGICTINPFNQRRLSGVSKSLGMTDSFPQVPVFRKFPRCSASHVE